MCLLVGVNKCFGPEKGLWLILFGASDLLGAGVLGDSLGSLGDSVFGQLSGEQESHGSLDFQTGDGAPLVVVGKAR